MIVRLPVQNWLAVFQNIDNILLMPIEYPRKLSLANTPTPLQPLDRYSEMLNGPRVWIKRDDLTGTTLSGNKIRKLEFVVAEAVANGAQVLLTCGGLQSNHCRATAVVAAQLGLKCHLILRGEKPAVLDGNTLLADMCGAEITYCSKASYRNHLDTIRDQLISEYESRGDKVQWIPTGASDEIGLWGYISGAEELQSDFNRLGIEVDRVFCATGSGGTHAGLALGFALMGKSCVSAYAVCDTSKYFQAKAEQDIVAWYQRFFPAQAIQMPNIDVNDDFIGPGYGVAGPKVYRCIRNLAKLEGVVLDPVYTGKAFFGLESQMRDGQFDHCDNLVFIHTGGLFGIFPHRDQFSI